MCRSLWGCWPASCRANIIWALVFAGGTLLIAAVAVQTVARRERVKFENQLPDTLNLLSTSLRAGYSLLQALEAVASEAPEPTGREFGRAINETRLGRSPVDSLKDVAERMESVDFDWAVLAISIQREVGGNLAEVLQTAAETMLHRNRLRREMKALTAEGRISAIVLSALPILLFAFLFLSNPDLSRADVQHDLRNHRAGGCRATDGGGHRLAQQDRDDRGIAMDQTLLFATVAIAVTMFALIMYIGMGVVKARESSANRLQSLTPTRPRFCRAASANVPWPPSSKASAALGMRFTPQGWGAKTNQRLMVAGWFPKVDANSWAAIRLVVLVAVGHSGVCPGGLVDGTTKLLVGGLVIAAGFFGPESVLTRKIDDRRKAIEKDLPDVIDLLVISVEAGLGFEAALGRVVQNVPGQLSDEFSRMLQETRVGVSRQEAMKSLAQRTDVDDLNSFILAMNQADAFGVSIASMLRVQADEIRVRRRQRAQERAFAAPVKMTFPLVFCIFPAIFTVLLGPAFIQIFETIL